MVLDPERKNPFDPTRNIYCRACKKPISEETLGEAVKLSAGVSVDDTFFPEKRRLYYHKECYENKDK